MSGARIFRISYASLALAAALVARPSQAQTVSGGEEALYRSDVAGVRTEPQFEPAPLLLGSWLVDAKLAFRTLADSNVLKTAASPISDTAFTVSPSLRLVKSFGAHAVSLSGRAEVRRWAKRSPENSETFDVNVGGRIDLGEGNQATWRTQYTRDVEPRGSAGSNDIVTGPPTFGLLQVALAGRRTLGPFTVTVGGGTAQRKYDALTVAGGGQRDQSFRDTRALFVAPRVSFAVVPSTSVFLGGSATKTISLNRHLGALRDGAGYAVLAGFRTEATRLIICEIGVGWRGQDYRNPSFRDFGELTYDATIDWYPTPLVSFRLQAAQDVVNSGIPQVAGISRRTLRWVTYYDPLRNFRLSFDLQQEKDRFRELGLATATATATLTGRYNLGRHIVMSSFWRWQNKNTSRGPTAGAYTAFNSGLALTGTF